MKSRNATISFSQIAAAAKDKTRGDAFRKIRGHGGRVTEQFIKTGLNLLAIPGLHPRLRELYGRLVWHAGRDGRCFPTWETLAREIGVKSRITVYRLMLKLRELRLVAWDKQRFGHYPNSYTILSPDVAFLQRQTLHPRNVLEVAYTQPIKEKSSSKDTIKRKHPRTQRKTSASKAANANAPKTAEPHFFDDDDEHAKPKPPPLSNPPDEFRRRLRARHGAKFDAGTVLKIVTRRLQRSDATFAGFLDFDAVRSTGKILNPGGFYTSLVKTFIAEESAAAEAAAQEIPTPPPERSEQPRDAKGRCVKCGGRGTLPGDTFCDCAMGRDMAKVSRRAAKPETRTAAKEGVG